MSKGKPKQLEPIDFEGATQEEGSLSHATATGTRLDRLRALRSKLAAHIDNPNTLARDLAALARRFQDLDKDIEELEKLEQQYGAEIEGEHHHAEDAPFDPSTL